MYLKKDFSGVGLKLILVNPWFFSKGLLPRESNNDFGETVVLFGLLDTTGLDLDFKSWFLILSEEFLTSSSNDILGTLIISFTSFSSKVGRLFKGEGDFSGVPGTNYCKY